MMTLGTLFREGKRRLREARVEEWELDAWYLWNMLPDIREMNIIYIRNAEWKKNRSRNIWT